MCAPTYVLLHCLQGPCRASMTQTSQLLMAVWCLSCAVCGTTRRVWRHSSKHGWHTTCWHERTQVGGTGEWAAAHFLKLSHCKSVTLCLLLVHTTCRHKTTQVGLGTGLAVCITHKPWVWHWCSFIAAGRSFCVSDHCLIVPRITATVLLVHQHLCSGQWHGLHH